MAFVYVHDLSESDETLKSTFSNIDDRHNLSKMIGSLVADGGSGNEWYIYDIQKDTN